MKLREVATRDVAGVGPDDSLVDAAGKMRSYDVGSLPVRQADRLVGIVTDRDIVLRCVAAGLDPKATRVREVMNTEVVTCPEDMEVQDAVRRMMESRGRRVVVVDPAGRPIGIVSLRDLALVPGGEALAGQVYAALAEQAASHS